MAQLVLPSQLRGRPPSPGSRRGLVRLKPVMEDVQAFTDASTRAPMGATEAQVERWVKRVGDDLDRGGYIEDLGATPTLLDAALVYLRAQKASTIVAVSDASGRAGVQGGGGYLVIGSDLWLALPYAVRYALPLGAVVSNPLVPSNARRVGTVGEILAAYEHSQRPLVIEPPKIPAARKGMSTGAKVAIGVGVAAGALYLLTRKRGSR